MLGVKAAVDSAGEHLSFDDDALLSDLQVPEVSSLTSHAGATNVCVSNEKNLSK